MPNWCPAGSGSRGVVVGGSRWVAANGVRKGVGWVVDIIESQFVILVMRGIVGDDV